MMVVKSQLQLTRCCNLERAPGVKPPLQTLYQFCVGASTSSYTLRQKNLKRLKSMAGSDIKLAGYPTSVLGRIYGYRLSGKCRIRILKSFINTYSTEYPAGYLASYLDTEYLIYPARYRIRNVGYAVHSLKIM